VIYIQSFQVFGIEEEILTSTGIFLLIGSAEGYIFTISQVKLSHKACI
jgi:hypothetical protein